MLSCNDITKRKLHKVGDRAWPYVLVAPAVIFICLLIIYPILKAIMMSFTATRFGEKAAHIGSANYIRLLKSPDFARIVRTTLVYTFVSVVGCIVVSMVTALLSNVQIPGRTIIRVITTLPWAIPEVASCLIWSWILNYDFGVLNYLLQSKGLIKEAVGWLIDPAVALSSVLLVTIWQIFPLSSMVLLAGLQGIPSELYEAARIDGGNSLQIFRYVTLPSLKPIANLLILLTAIWSIRRFTVIWVLTRGGPAMATETIVINVYHNAFRNFDMGYACAVGVVGLILSLILTAIYFMFQAKTEAY